jgi:prevent-host-death family protein
MEHVGAFDAKNHLSSLLERAEKGEEIMITKHGRPMARLMPPKPVGPAFDPEKARKAIAKMRKIRKKMKLGRFDWKEWKAYRDEGRP